MSESFQFKQFEIQHDRCAQKVGTDAILLGSWAGKCCIPPKQILDVGTGCGVIALMLAQRFPLAHLAAVEVDKQAAEQAGRNFHSSDWASRLQIHHADVRAFVTAGKFDLVVCNPPFFESSLRSPERRRNVARHDDRLSFDDLSIAAARLLNRQGRLSVVVPAERVASMVNAANRSRLYTVRRCQVRPTARHSVRRVLLEFCFGRLPSLEQSELAVEASRHEYSDAYSELAREFLLKL